MCVFRTVEDKSSLVELEDAVMSWTKGPRIGLTAGVSCPGATP